MTKNVPPPAGSKGRASHNNSTGVPQDSPEPDLRRTASAHSEPKSARQDIIGPGLKRLFDQVVEEPVPPEFLALLEQIDRSQDK